MEEDKEEEIQGQTGPAGPEQPRTNSTVPGTENPLTKSELQAEMQVLGNSIDSFKGIVEGLSRPIWAMISLVIFALVLGLVSSLATMYSLILESNNFKTSAYEQLNSHVIELNNKLDLQKK